MATGAQDAPKKDMSKEHKLTAEERQQLIEAACKARERAYAPYSHFSVGAAVLTGKGGMFTGVNVENASYGLTVCAERNAVAAMIDGRENEIRAVAVCTVNGVAPCGACRQVLSEFAPPGSAVPVWMIDSRGNVRETTLSALLPDKFVPGDLP